MIVGHLPSGYILGRILRVASPALMFACVLGAIFPDFDLLFFYLVDDRAIHHHRYWVHAPGFWLIVSCLIAPVLWFVSRKLLILFAAFVAGNFLHVVLDSIAGGIMWAWPFSRDLMSPCHGSTHSQPFCAIVYGPLDILAGNCPVDHCAYTLSAEAASWVKSFCNGALNFKEKESHKSMALAGSSPNFVNNVHIGRFLCLVYLASVL